MSSYQRYRTANFGRSRAGLTTVGYSVDGVRSAAGVTEVAPGVYGATVTFAGGFVGPLVWDTGEATPVYVVGAINPGSDEWLDAPVSSSATGAGGTVQLDLTQPLADVRDGTVGGALHGAWTSAFGKVTLDRLNKVLRLFGFGSQATPLATFDLDSATNPTQRTPR